MKTHTFAISVEHHRKNIFKQVYAKSCKTYRIKVRTDCIRRNARNLLICTVCVRKILLLLFNLENKSLLQFNFFIHSALILQCNHWQIFRSVVPMVHKKEFRKMKKIIQIKQ